LAADSQNDAIDPSVWTGRALQVDFAELAVSSGIKIKDHTVSKKCG
jgi:hypothetical protein